MRRCGQRSDQPEAVRAVTESARFWAAVLIPADAVEFGVARNATRLVGAHIQAVGLPGVGPQFVWVRVVVRPVLSGVGAVRAGVGRRWAAGGLHTGVGGAVEDYGLAGSEYGENVAVSAPAVVVHLAQAGYLGP